MKVFAILQRKDPDSHLQSSVADPFHFDTDPDPKIRFVEKRVRILIVIRPKIEKNVTFFIYKYFILW